ncbi:unnamed protein product [Lymnaea stagnalis]|uniref:Laminin subunit alpha-1 n=1 Tax=Lymnaea stagnalis TaxID=6523 RepID=A0AAV2IFI4_LYMST
MRPAGVQVWTGLFLACVYLEVALGQGEQEDLNGLFPLVFNLAAKAKISANATCGESKPELFCKLVEHVRIFPAENRHCDICDAMSNNSLQRHPITNAIDGSNRWWQSPTLTNGAGYNHVTITVDMGQIYQVAYVIVKAANAPRPGNWILERSIDGVVYRPWQYFAMSDKECRDAYRIQPTVGVPTFLGDNEVICTSRYSALDPYENGEIFVSLVNGRPGVFQPSQDLLEFTSARYVRLRLQKIRTLNADLMTYDSIDPRVVDETVTRRYYYSIKDISIGGQCICYGHATHCLRHETLPDRLRCYCLHNTAGDNCEKCLPMFNNKPWQVGGIQNLGCEECNCHGKADACYYNATVDALGLGLNMNEEIDGGGVCLNCRDYTTGVNCERCIDGYYRPLGMTPQMRFPCRPCNCKESPTTTGQCVLDDSRVDQGLNPGDCICKRGYTGSSCNSCEIGYYGYPNCRPCLCNVAGSVDPSACDRACVCKANVDGSRCDRCKQGFFNLEQSNLDGCTECFCFGVSKTCDSVAWGLTQVNDLNGWKLDTLEPGGITLIPLPNNGWLETQTYADNIDPRSYSRKEDIHYWVAPPSYLGNRVSSYGGYLQYTVKYSLDDDVARRYHLTEPSFVLEGFNMSISSEKERLRENVENVKKIRLHEGSWFHLDSQQPVTRKEMMTVLYNLNRLMLRATYHTAQDTVSLKGVLLDIASPMVMDNSSLKTVEQCRCPEGYAGLSCESCSPGWRRINNKLFEGICRKCECYNHASECDSITGQCINCRHSTVGNRCDRCLPGFYGDPRHGSPDDCKPCACPLTSGNNFFAEKCETRPTAQDRSAYECLNCRPGYMGSRCEMCAPGYFGNPTEPGGSCRRCNCGGDPRQPVLCNNVTGTCTSCSSNTEGDYCERCKAGFYGSAVNGDCRPCDCFDRGSNNFQCHPRNGQCSCRERYTGRRCDRCQPGYGNVERGCERCNCHRQGSESVDCDPVSGQCTCRTGIGGLYCDECDKGYYEFSRAGCKRCNCYGAGTNNTVDCEPVSGRCICKPGVAGNKCDRCELNHYGIGSGKGCSPCSCSNIGSTNVECDAVTGQCSCKPGVGGIKCDQCLPGYYGYSRLGCERCEPCDKPGHICDQTTGQCVCPPNMEGPKCEKCITNGWGFDPDGGCKLCNCSLAGSQSQQCDPKTGQCTCMHGYQGLMCDYCGLGFYDTLTNCTNCDCHQPGVLEDTCTESLCECDSLGSCFCKKNVEGRNCDKCRLGTFSLKKDNPDGCTECYCFHRSQSCQQAPYVYSEVNNILKRIDGQPVTMKYGYQVINSADVYIPTDKSDQPLYWELKNFTRDMILSYNGKLKFMHYFESPSIDITTAVSAPLAVLIGNGIQIHAKTSLLEPGNLMQVEIKLNEHEWTLGDQSRPLTRRIMMVVLQNVQAILIRAAQDGTATNAELDSIILDRAGPKSGATDSDQNFASGVEICMCPDRYSGESCQNPGPGYYREIPNITGTNLDTVESIIGNVKPCYCNNHSTLCDAETGLCQDCKDNTVGNYCDKCTDGYFGVATKGNSNDCQPCACPLAASSNNFSPTCVSDRRGIVCTACQEGYTGRQCDSCSSGYYGNPKTLGERCKPCHCNPEGSLNLLCDAVSGQCTCISGISGRNCDECSDPTFGVQNGQCISCYTGCTGILLDDLKNLSIPLNKINISGAAYPWEQLYRFEAEANELKGKLSGAQAAGIKELDNMMKEAQRYNSIADNLVNRVNSTGTKACKIKDSASEVLKNATEIDKLIKQTFEDIKKLVEGLEDLVQRILYNQSGIDMTAALNNSYEILKEILSRNFKPADDAAKQENTLAEKLSESIYAFINQSRLNDTALKNQISDITRRLKDLIEQSEKADRTTNEANDLIQKLWTIQYNKNKTKIYKLKNTPIIWKISINSMQLNVEIMKRSMFLLEMDLSELINEIRKLKSAAEDIIDNAKELLSKAEVNLISSTGQDGILDTALEDLADKVNNLIKSMPRLRENVNDAFKHQNKLKEQADLIMNQKMSATNFIKMEHIDLLTLKFNVIQLLMVCKADVSNITKSQNGSHDSSWDSSEYFVLLDYKFYFCSSLFSKTRDFAEDAVRAARAYQDIVDAINEARKSAEDALKAAKESVDIAKVEDLQEEVQDLVQKKIILNLIHLFTTFLPTGLNDLLKTVDMELEKVNDKHKSNADVLEEIKRKLNLLPSGKYSFSSDIADIVSRIQKKSQDAETTADKAIELVKKLNATMMHMHDDLKPPDYDDFNFEIESQCKKSRDNIRNITTRTSQVENNISRVRQKMNDISYDLENLKAKISDARSRVNDMKMSLLADGQCYRSYRSPLLPSSTNEIRFGFKLNDTSSDMLIILLQQSTQEYFAAEIRDKKVRLSWDSGKGPGIVSHNQELEINKWYQVLAKRVGTIGQLKVWNMEKGTEQSSKMEIATVGAGCSLMNLNENATVLLAGSSRNYKIPEGITRKNFVGCLGDVFLDSKKIGVYNYKTDVKDHCAGCDEVYQSAVASSKVYVFNGRGFASFKIKNYESMRTRMELEFKTFWENSRIFFIGNTAMGDYFSIELQEGRIYVRYYMGGISSGFGHTTNTYNNNQWTKIIFNRRARDASLLVGTERIDMKSGPGNQTGLDLPPDSIMYFGGIPTSLVTNKFKGINDTQYFFGCMRNLNVGNLSPDDDTSQLVGVQASSGCRENGIHNVGFNGDGYLMLQSDKLDFSSQKNDISLTFVTKKENAIIIIARDIPSENFYSILLEHGELVAIVEDSRPSPPVRLNSERKYNDGNMHCVSLVKDGSQIQLMVDDVIVALGESRDVKFENTGDLYLGGSPIAVDDITPTASKLDGCISDIIANGVLLSMGDAKQYKRANVGQCKFSIDLSTPVVAPRSLEAPPPNDVSSPTACVQEPKYEAEDNAKSVANTASFFAEIFKVNPDDLSINFVFEFEFRTYYPNGLFGYLANNDKSFYFGIQLRNGRLEIAYTYQDRISRVNFEGVANDGKWHSVHIMKSNNTLTVKFDRLAKSGLIDQVLNIALPLHLGGPADRKEFINSNIDLVDHSVRGCIRSLAVNNVPINITDTQVIQDVTGCFKNVEPGVYFGGDGWGMYANDFVIKSNFIISLEFRTTSQDGILVSASDPARGMGITLELHDGKLKFALRNSAGLYRVETGNENLYHFCDNKWHNVRATLTNESLSISADFEPFVKVNVEGMQKNIKTENPLFIGGFELAFTQVASLSSDMFIGCLKNLALDYANVDWYSLVNQKNVMKTACPTS